MKMAFVTEVVTTTNKKTVMIIILMAMITITMPLMIDDIDNNDEDTLNGWEYDDNVRDVNSVERADFNDDNNDVYDNCRVHQGMGEPLANLSAVGSALDILTCQPGLQISPARVTISTSGLVPQVLPSAILTRGRIRTLFR